jgi:hypothetical protein
MPESITGWLVIYLVSGGVLLASLRLYNEFFKKKEDKTNWVKDVLESLEDSKPKSLSVRQVVKVILFVMLVLMVWPFAIAVAIKETIFPSRNEFRLKPEDYFKCKKNCLVKKVIPQEVEAKAIVSDPKGRVPNLPFGHLHSGWIKLLGQLEKGDSLWSFKTPGWTAFKGERGATQWAIPRDVVSGYAVVRNGKVKAEFLTEWD